MFKKLLGEYKREIDKRLGEFFEERVKEAGETGEEVVEVVRGLREIGLRGKRLRGFLVIVGYGVGRGWRELKWEEVPEEVWQVSMGLELFHLGLLVQDDVMDKDEERRGVRALHTRYDDLHYGEAMANLGADMCFGWAGKLLAESGNLEVVKRWGKYFERVAMGQMIDLMISEKLKVGRLDEYEKVMRLKTGEYTGEMPLVLGALLGGGDKDLREKLGGWGLEWGVGFQIRDDLLDRDGLVELVREGRARERLKEQVGKARKTREMISIGAVGVGRILKELEDFLVA